MAAPAIDTALREFVEALVRRGDAPSGRPESDVSHGIEHRLQELGARPRQWGPELRAA